jgi:hypothetical protein
MVTRPSFLLEKDQSVAVNNFLFPYVFRTYRVLGGEFISLGNPRACEELQNADSAIDEISAKFQCFKKSFTGDPENH